MKGRVRKVRADLGSLEAEVAVLRARVRAIGDGTEMTLNLDEVEMVQEWYGWAADAGVRSAFSGEGRALADKLIEVLDRQSAEEVE